MITEEVRHTLLKVARLIPEGASWAVDGSCALALQGITVTPHDIDILTDAESAYKIEDTFSDFSVQTVKYGETDEWRSHFGIFLVDTVKVEIMGDLQSFRNGKWSLVQNPRTVQVRSVELDGAQVPVVSITFLGSTGYLQRRLKREQIG